MSEVFEITKVKKTSEGEPVVVTVVDKEYGETQVSLKWDGCINYHRYENGYRPSDENVPPGNISYIHICEVDKMIEQLQEIKRIAENQFSKENYNRYWK